MTNLKCTATLAPTTIGQNTAIELVTKSITDKISNEAVQQSIIKADKLKKPSMDSKVFAIASVLMSRGYVVAYYHLMSKMLINKACRILVNHGFIDLAKNWEEVSQVAHLNLWDILKNFKPYDFKGTTYTTLAQIPTFSIKNDDGTQTNGNLLFYMLSNRVAIRLESFIESTSSINIKRARKLADISAEPNHDDMSQWTRRKQQLATFDSFAQEEVNEDIQKDTSNAYNAVITGNVINEALTPSQLALLTKILANGTTAGQSASRYREIGQALKSAGLSVADVLGYLSHVA